ncbi:MAG TPA: chemotaxis protein CheA [Gemmatimonadaceae bacterium]
MDLAKYAELFLTESREHLSVLNDQLLALEREPTAAEPVGAIFRAVHTVKGMSATMGYRAVTELAHELESVLDRVRREQQTITPALMDALFTAADALEAAIEASVQGRGDDVDVATPVERLKAFAAASRGAGAPAAGTPARATPARGAAATAPAAPAPPAVARGSGAGRGVLVRVRLVAGTTLRGARAFLVVKKAETLGTVVAVVPPLEALQAEAFDRDFALRLDTTLPADEVIGALRSVGDVETVSVESPRTGGAAVAGGRGAGGTGAPAGAGAATGGGARAPARAPRHVRIDLRRLDTLMNLVGELVITRGRLQQLVASTGDGALEEVVSQASRLIGELQDEIMLSRMVPVGHVFDRFPRLVRDAAKALGKEITFEVRGSDIELDRSMLDEIGDPIVHLLRNAIDHGIEPPDARVAAGKPPSGTLTLSVARERSTVTLRVADDGRGIDRVRVLQKAKEQGLVDAGKTELTDDEISRVIARPGFSTAERVTDLSGRGVGIDVVMNRVRAMGGAVEIRSRQGQGTAVTVRLPLTLAIVRALLARVHDEVYAVPLAHVTETVELAPRAVKQVQGREVMVLRDDVLPLIRFRELVRLNAPPSGPGQVIVLEVGDRRAALVVDELTGQQEIVVKQFDPVRDGLALFSGATILPDGAPALIVDVGSLI